METVSIDDFKKLDIRIGKIISAEKVEWSEKLLKLQISFGEKELQILSGIYPKYKPEDMVGKLVPVIVNLLPRKIRELESQGMMLAAVVENEAILLHPDSDVPPGAQIA